MEEKAEELIKRGGGGVGTEVVSRCGVNERSLGPHLTQREGVTPRNI